MFGYSVTAIRVVRKSADDAPLQVDNIDGQGLDLAAEWRRYFRDSLQDHQVRARRFWLSARASALTTRSSAGYTSLEVEYGPNGIPGRVYDTANGQQRASVRNQDAAVHRYRHVLARPVGGSAALLAGEVIGRGRAQAGPLDHFRKSFEQSQPDLKLTFDSVTDGEYWQQFLASAVLVSATVRRQVAVPSYLSQTTAGTSNVAIHETTIKPAVRGGKWARPVFAPLLAGRVTPNDVFGIGFDPDQTALVFQADGQQRTIYLDADEPPSFTYPIGDPDRPDQPSGAEFTQAAEETLDRLLPLFR